MSRRSLPFALALVLAPYGLLFGRLAVNRLAPPDAVLELTERELPLARPSEGGPTTRLQIRWEQRQAWLDGGPGWFDQSKLEELGFRCSVPASDPHAQAHYSRVLPRPVYAVLEFEGEAWEAWLAQKAMELHSQAARVEKGEMAQEEYRAGEGWNLRSRQTRSRLFAVDAGRDPAGLRERYPDRNRFLVAKAVVRPLWRPRDGGGYLAGEVSDILIDTVPVPAGRWPILDRLRAEAQDAPPDSQWSESREPRYRVRLCWGWLRDPWVESVETLTRPGR